MGVLAAARAFGLDFVPVTKEPYDLVLELESLELPALDAELTKRVARGFVDSTEIIAEHFRGCGFAPARASSTAAALVAALEGARTIARLERTPGSGLRVAAAKPYQSPPAPRPIPRGDDMGSDLGEGPPPRL